MLSNRFCLLLLCLLPGCSCRENQEAKVKQLASSVRNEFLEPFEEHKYVNFTYTAPEDDTYVHVLRVVKMTDGKLCYPVIVRHYPAYAGPLGGVESHPGLSRLLDPCLNQADPLIIPLDPRIERYIFFIRGEGKRGNTIPEESKWYSFECPDPVNMPVVIPNITDLKLLSETSEYQKLLDKLDEAEARIKPPEQR